MYRILLADTEAQCQELTEKEKEMSNAEQTLKAEIISKVFKS